MGIAEVPMSEERHRSLEKEMELEVETNDQKAIVKGKVISAANRNQ